MYGDPFLAKLIAVVKKGEPLMSKMNELYSKVSKDGMLQAKFAELMKKTEGQDETTIGEQAVAFAKELGFDVTAEEVAAFFKELETPKAGELSDEDLDMVAGGKSSDGEVNVRLSVYTLGLYCALCFSGRGSTCIRRLQPPVRVKRQRKETSRSYFCNGVVCQRRGYNEIHRFTKRYGHDAHGRNAKGDGGSGSRRRCLWRRSYRQPAGSSRSRKKSVKKRRSLFRAERSETSFVF